MAFAGLSPGEDFFPGPEGCTIDLSRPVSIQYTFLPDTPRPGFVLPSAPFNAAGLHGLIEYRTPFAAGVPRFQVSIAAFFLFLLYFFQADPDAPDIVYSFENLTEFITLTKIFIGRLPALFPPAYPCAGLNTLYLHASGKPPALPGTLFEVLKAFRPGDQSTGNDQKYRKKKEGVKFS